MQSWRLYISAICLSLLLVASGCGSDDATTPEETIPPPVSSTIPPDGATDVGLDVVITAVFVDDIEPSSITESTFTLSYNPLVRGTVSYDEGTKTATFTPDDSLEYSTTYTVTITAELRDVAAMAGPMTITYSWMFITISFGPGVSDLPRTGQTRSYATGDDGSLQIGVTWPSPRFTDNEDGTITDNLTGLMWLKDAHCFGFRTGSNEAYLEIDTLNIDPLSCECQDYTKSYTDWRLPNVNELESLINAGQQNSATWLGTQGFVNVQQEYYWTSTTYAYNTMMARQIHMWAGYVDRDEKRFYNAVWPVRGTSTGPAAVWKTGQTTSYRADDDGDLQMGTKWPIPRFFLTNDNAKLIDLVTGLMWMRSAETPAIGECTGGRMTWQEALDYIACINSMEYLGCSDWRLPNRKELYSLIDHSMYNPALPSDHTFGGVQLAKYWTSTTYAYDTSEAWMVSMQYGDLSPWGKSYTCYVWPVRGGQ